MPRTVSPKVAEPDSCSVTAFGSLRSWWGRIITLGTMFNAGDTGEPDDGRRITEPNTIAPALEPAQIAPASHADLTASNRGDPASTECRCSGLPPVK